MSTDVNPAGNRCSPIYIYMLFFILLKNIFHRKKMEICDTYQSVNHEIIVLLESPQI